MKLRLSVLGSKAPLSAPDRAAAAAWLRGLEADLHAKRAVVRKDGPERGAALEAASRGAAIIEGQNALHAAAKMGWNKIARFLIDSGIRQQVVDSTGRTPYDLAMGIYPAAYNAPPTEPLLETAAMLREACLNVAGCVVPPPSAPTGKPAP